MKNYLKLLLCIGLVVAMTSCSKDKRWPDGSLYKTVDISQILSNPRKYDGRNISIYGYFKHDIEGDYIIFPSREHYFARFTNTALYVKTDRKITSCVGKYTVSTGRLDIDGNLMFFELNSVEWLLDVPPIETSETDIRTSDFRSSHC